MFSVTRVNSWIGLALSRTIGRHRAKAGVLAVVLGVSPLLTACASDGLASTPTPVPQPTATTPTVPLQLIDSTNLQQEGTASSRSLPVPKLPHSGTTDQQCYQQATPATNDLRACGDAAALALSGAQKQDGMRTDINPMSYSTVAGQADKTHCLKDDVTGLIWEIKVAGNTDPRGADTTYKNEEKMQAGSYPSGRSGQALEYVKYLNGDTRTAIANGIIPSDLTHGLCGLQGWRLPTMAELQSLVDYGKTSGPTISRDFGANLTGTTFAYWTSTPVAGNNNFVLGVNFGDGGVYVRSRNDDQHIRLVRTSQ